MTKRIILLTQWFDPEPTTKGMVFARELVDRGYEVEVITGFPNYPGGKVYPGYKIKPLQREYLDGVEVTRVPLYPSHNGSGIQRVFNYISFCLSAMFYAIFMAKQADVMYAYHPPLTTGVAAAVIKVFRKIPVVYDIQDMWPDTLRATGMVNNDSVLNIVSSVCQWVYKNIDRIVVLSPGFKHLLIERGVPAEKVEVIYNWCDEAALSVPIGGVPDSFPSSDEFTILFAGTMGKAQALEGVIEAAKIIQTQQPQVNFVFVGGGIEVENLKQIAENSQLTNVIFIPKVPMDRVGAMLQRAEVLLVHLKDDPLFKITIPSKIQAYLAVGKPILVCVQGDAAAIVEEAQCGRVAISENSQSIADGVLYLSSLSTDELVAMGANAQAFYKAKMSLKVGVDKFSETFDRVIRDNETRSNILTDPLSKN
jgi:colanic acid biosynthesis glycosyl transferase WcaI